MVKVEGDNRTQVLCVGGMEKNLWETLSRNGRGENNGGM